MKFIFNGKEEERKIYWMVDSGAFTVRNKKGQVDIHRYIEFLQKFKDYIYIYVNLDVIGDARKTLRNQEIMESKGLSPLPVFHHGENFKYLENYVEKYPYVGLGQYPKIDWLNQCWEIIRPDGKNPRCKVHALGMTEHYILKKYPWASADSYTWGKTTRYGSILVPRMRGDKYDYSDPPHKFHVSNGKPLKRDKTDPHKLHPNKKISKEDLLYIQKFLDHINQEMREGKKVERKENRFRLFLVTDPANKTHSESFIDYDYQNRLVSFFYLDKYFSEKKYGRMRDSWISLYLQTGFPPEHFKKLPDTKIYRHVSYLDLKDKPPEEVTKYLEAIQRGEDPPLP